LGSRDAQEIFMSAKTEKTGSRDTPTVKFIAYVGTFPERLKRSERESNRMCPFIAEVKKE